MLSSCKNAFSFLRIRPQLQCVRSVVIKKRDKPKTGAVTSEEVESVGKEAQADYDSPIIQETTGYNLGEATADTYAKYGYDKIETDWRSCYEGCPPNYKGLWPKWRMKKDLRKRMAVEKYGPMKTRLRAMVDNAVLPQAFRDDMEQQFEDLPRDSRHLILRKHCMLTAKHIGNLRLHRVSRFVFRDMSDHGKISGVRRAFWGP